MTGPIGAVDIGGSHVAAAVIANGVIGQMVHLSFPETPRSTAQTLDVIGQAMLDAGSASRWIVAVPGPFGYAAGLSLITGLGKLDELYEVNLRTELTNRFGDLCRIEFVNDAHAAGLGEWGHGAGGRAHRMLFVGLGTGLGSAFIENGDIVETGPQVPPGGHLGLTTFDGLLADDLFSTRGLLAETGYADATQLTVDAAAGRRSAVERCERFGRDIERLLTPWCEAFTPESVVFGGGLSNAYPHFSAGFVDALFRDRCRPARDPETAALHGIAVLADRQ